MSSRALRGAAIVLLGFSAVFAILSGVGTSCVAWGATNYQPFASLAPYGWLFQLLVFVNVAAGGAGLFVTFSLMRRKSSSYVGSLLMLLIFVSTAVVQMYYSSSLRGVSFFATPPTSIRFYLTSVVLLYFLALKVRPLWIAAGMAPGLGETSIPKGVSAAFLLVAGLTVLTTPVWAGASHVIDGYNFVNVLLLPISISGGSLVLGGVFLLVPPPWRYVGLLLYFKRRGAAIARRMRLG
jgi:hypothetical protein